MSRQGKTNYVTQQQLKTIRGGSGIGHIHTNKDVLDSITAQRLLAWDAKQDPIQDLSTIRTGANEGHVAYLWGNHANAGYITGITKAMVDAVGANADTLDGQHASYFAAASLLGNYLPLSGGTMTGALTLDYENTWGGHNGCIKWKNNRQSASGGGRNDEFFTLLKADGTYNASFGLRGNNEVDNYLYIGYSETNAFRIYPNGNIEVTGNIIRNTTGQSIGTSAAPWGEIHANKWYPNANDTINYIEYTGSGFLIHGNVAVTGQLASRA